MRCCGPDQTPQAKVEREQFLSCCSEEDFQHSWFCWRSLFCVVISPKKGKRQRLCAGGRPNCERRNALPALEAGNGSWRRAPLHGPKSFTISPGATPNKLHLIFKSCQSY